MSGHSKWATIKRKKAVTDAKRGKLFTQVIKEITIAARMGGGDIKGNARLRLAIDKAKASNMPADNIKRAIQKGTGELPGVTYEDVVYEGYGPGGVALIIESVTDNRNRTVSEIRNILERQNGKLGAANSVAYMFNKKGIISVARSKYDEDELMELVLEAGAEDMKSEEETYEIVTSADTFITVKEAMETKGVPPDSAGIQLIPETTVRVSDKDAEQVLKLVELLEEHDDVQQVYANFDIDDEVLASFNS